MVYAYVKGLHPHLRGVQHCGKGALLYGGWRGRPTRPFSGGVYIFLLKLIEMGQNLSCNFLNLTLNDDPRPLFRILLTPLHGVNSKSVAPGKLPGRIVLKVYTGQCEDMITQSYLIGRFAESWWSIIEILLWCMHIYVLRDYFHIWGANNTVARA